MGKGEIARYKQFLLFPQCFQKACFPGVSKGVTVWEWVNSLTSNKVLDGTKFKAFAEVKFNVAKKMISLFVSIENIVGKEENDGYQHFSFSLNVFQSLLPWWSEKVNSSPTNSKF